MLFGPGRAEAVIAGVSIVYDTEQAVASVGALDDKLDGLDRVNKTVLRSTGHVSRSMSNTANAAVHLAQGLADGNLSAATLSRSLMHLGGPVLGGVAVGVGLVAAGFAIVTRHMDEQAKKTKEFAKEADDARKVVDKLLGIRRNDTEEGIRDLTKRIKDLQKEINKPGMFSQGWFERLWGGVKSSAADLATHFGGMHASDAGPSPERVLQDQLVVQRGILESGIRLEQHFGALANFGGYKSFQQGATPSEQAAMQAATVGARSTAMIGVGGTPGQSAHSIDEAARAMVRAQQAADRLRDQLYTVADAIEDFVVTGTFAFQRFLDNILGLLFRQLSDKVITKLVSAAYPSSGVQGFASGGVVPGAGPQLAIVHGGETIIPASGGAGMATSVNFHIYAHDSQDAHRFIKQNASMIARETVNEIERTHALRRRIA